MNVLKDIIILEILDVKNAYLVARLAIIYYSVHLVNHLHLLEKDQNVNVRKDIMMIM